MRGMLGLDGGVLPGGLFCREGGTCFHEIVQDVGVLFGRLAPCFL
jgi:hypothetical protein